MKSRCYFNVINLNCLVFSTFTGGWPGGWSEDWRVMLNSTQDEVEVEVRVELGNDEFMIYIQYSLN